MDVVNYYDKINKDFTTYREKYQEFEGNKEDEVHDWCGNLNALSCWKKVNLEYSYFFLSDWPGIIDFR